MITLNVDRDGSISVPPPKPQLLRHNKTNGYLKTITNYDDSMFVIKDEPAATATNELPKIKDDATIGNDDVTTSSPVFTVPSFRDVTTTSSSDVTKMEVVDATISEAVSNRRLSKVSKFQSSMTLS